MTSILILAGVGFLITFGFLIYSLCCGAKNADYHTEMMERGMATRQEIDKHGGGNCAAE